MTRGLFAEWQPRYAEHGIATFPVRGKVPAIRNYLRLRPPAAAASSDVSPMLRPSGSPRSRPG